MKLYFYFIFFIFLLAQKSEGRTLEGVLLEKGTKTPLVGASVFLLPSGLKSLTNEKGQFRFESVDKNEVQWIVNLAGFIRFDQKQNFKEKDPQVFKKTIYLERVSYAGAFETTIVGQEDQRELQKKTLTRSEVLKLPGAGGDPIKAVQNLPGVNRVSSFQSNVVIQGSAPQDTKYTLNSHEIPLVFHFGGLTSVVFPEAFESVDYLSAGYGAEYSRALGGLINVKLRSPRKDRVHGIAYVDLLNSGALVEGPVGKKGSFLLSGRYSYIGPVLKAIAPSGGGFNLTVAPQYSDLLAIYERPLTVRDDFKLSMIGSFDTLKFLLENPMGQDPAIRGNFYLRTNFYRILPSLVHRHSSKTISRYSIGYGQDFLRTDLSDNYFDLINTQLSVRSEVERKWSPLLTSQFGIDNIYQNSKVSLNLPRNIQAGGVSNPFSAGETVAVTIKRKTNFIGIFQRNEWSLYPDKLKLIPAVRADYFSSTHQWLLGLRLLAQYFIQPFFQVRSAGGIYYQAPQPQEVDKDFGNPDLKAQRATHASLTFEKDFRENKSDGIVLSIGGYYRYFDRLVIPSYIKVLRNGEMVAERNSNKGEGKAFGGEVFLKGTYAPLSGWLSYSISRSVRSEPGRDEYLYRYDQTHNVNLVLAYELPKNWSIGSRIRYVTGNLYTPILGGTYDTDNAVTIPKRGPFFSERLEAFYQVDLRVDKKWIYNTWILSAYLDIQNVTNRKNIESVSYAYDYSSKENVSGLPILPTLGIKGEF